MTTNSLPEQVVQGAMQHLNDDHQKSLRVATALVETPKARRYLKALCNHFDRKANASYDDNNGRIQFAFGECELQAEDNLLLISVTAETDATFARVKQVVADHLIRFGVNEALQVTWADAETEPAAN